jgi:hypothetical protein
MKKPEISIKMTLEEASKAIMNGLEDAGFCFGEDMEVWHIYQGYDVEDIVEFELRPKKKGLADDSSSN